MMIMYAAPALSADYGSAVFTFYSENGHTDTTNSQYISYYDDTVTICYAISGNDVDISAVDIRISYQQSSWTSLPVSSTGSYYFDPAYWTDFCTELKVEYTDSHVETFTAPLVMAVHVLVSAVPSPLPDPIAPYPLYKDPGTPHEVTYYKCRQGECVIVTTRTYRPYPEDECTPATQEVDC